MTRPVLTASDRQRYAIARSRERRTAELAPVLVEVDRLVADIGWCRARPVVEAVMAPVSVSGPRGVWRRRIGKRTGRRLVEALAMLPAQRRLPLAPASRPRRSVHTEARPA